MSGYDSGLYRTQNGRFAVYYGGRWREFYADFRLDTANMYVDPPVTWGKLTLISVPDTSDTDAEILNKVKQWWEKAAKREEADWAPLIDLASILMGTKKEEEST